MPVEAINSFQQFQDLIHGDKPIVIDLWAPWCGPCRFISPIFERLSENPEFGNVGFYKVNVDEQEHIAQELGVRAMPTFVLFHKGGKVDELVGANQQGLDGLLAKAASL